MIVQCRIITTHINKLDMYLDYLPFRTTTVLVPNYLYRVYKGLKMSGGTVILELSNAILTSVFRNCGLVLVTHRADRKMSTSCSTFIRSTM